MTDRPQIYSHCTYCGAPFPLGLGWPRLCAACGNISFRNPIPVAVVLVPVIHEGKNGVLAVRRSIMPQAGWLALPGGYVNWGETWQEAGAREVFEEAGVTLDPAELREFCVRSAPDGTLIIFAVAGTRRAADLPPFLPNEEASERVVLTEVEPLAFGLHSEVLALFLDGKPPLELDQ